MTLVGFDEAGYILRIGISTIIVIRTMSAAGIAPKYVKSCSGIFSGKIFRSQVRIESVRFEETLEVGFRVAGFQ